VSETKVYLRATWLPIEGAAIMFSSGCLSRVRPLLKEKLLCSSTNLTLLKNSLTTRVCIFKISYIVDFTIDDEPKRVFSVVLGDLRTCEGLMRHCDNTSEEGGTVKEGLG
jgi:hypothetical protein